MEAQSFASRRPAANSLPPFALPPPNDIPSTRYPSHAASLASYSSSSMSHQHQHPPYHHQGNSNGAPPSGPSPLLHPPLPTAASLSSTSPSFALKTPIQSASSLPTTSSTATAGTSILTPTSGAAADSLSPASGMSSQSSQPGMYYMGSSTAAAAPHHWGAPSGPHSYTYSNSNSANSGSGGLVQPQASYNQRAPYLPASPSLPSFSGRSSSSPQNNEGVPPPSGFQDPQPFGSSLGGGGGGGPLPTLGGLGQGASSHSVLAQPILNSQAHSAGTQPPTPVSAAGPSPPETGYRAGPNPSPFYTATSTPQQSSFAAYAGPPHPSPPIPSPTTSGGLTRSLASISGQSPMAPPLGGPGLSYGQTGRSPTAYGGGYGQPGLGPAVMSNLHNPGTPMAMMGVNGVGPLGLSPGFPPPHGQPHMGHPMYSHHGPPQTQDRPFKCDQCPQSFNRNHDLKRHKRIHLAVKPFPCNFCDKSFSRKDALKRHRLVKGCGEKAREAENNGETSPNGRNETGSDDADSPRLKKE